MKSAGELLRERREAFSADLQEAARWCGEAPDWLEDKEARNDLSAVDFERICRGLAISPEALLRGEGDTPTRSVARFRSALENPNILTSSDLRLLATASEIGIALADVLLAQGKEPSFGRYRNLHGPSQNLPPWEDGYELGEAARAMLIPLEGPVIELERELMRLGVHIARVSFSAPEIEAASIWEAGAVPVILLNTSTTRAEYSLSRRAILAHEVSHLLHDGGQAEIATRVTCAMCNWQDAVEKRARAFAPAFLAPRKQVREWASTANLPTDPAHRVHVLASYWGLSFLGAVWHAKNCKLIESEIAQELAEMDIQPDLPMDRFETAPVRPSSLAAHPELGENLSPLMETFATKVVIEALENSAISLGRAKELLSWR
jgi:Zn-dependent peptidase ImmA (M78 family)